MKHSRELLFCALSVLASLAGSSDVDAQAVAAVQAGAFAAVDYPGAASTQVWNISPRGDIAGVYTTADSVSHGFLLSHSSFTSIDYPGAALTLVNGINARGDIVGEFAATGTGPHRGFLFSNSRFWPIDYAGAASTAGIGIASNGDILGSYTLPDNSSHGFLLTGNTFMKIDYPGAASTVVGGISPGGDVVGGYAGHAFLLSHGQFTTWDYPGAAFTNALARNVSGDIVGRYRDSAGVTHGYLLSSGQFTSFDFPGASFTGSTGIAKNGDIVGRYMVARVSHGFLLTSRERHEPAYKLTDLGPVGGPPGQALFISNPGVISGAAAASNGAMHAVLWYQRMKLDIGARGLGGLNSVAFNVNERGQTVGYAETSSADPNGEDFCGFKTLGLPYQDLACRPFLWQNGAISALPTLGGANGVASWINNRGEVAGWAENATQDSGCPAPQRLQFKPVIWTNGGVRELPSLGDSSGIAISINDTGQVVGGTGECSPYNQAVLANLQPIHAVLWQDGIPTNLGTLGGTGHFLGNVATAINNKGQVVGSSDLPGDTANHAFLWSSETGMQDLGTLPGDIGSGAIGINDRGEVVGVSVDANFNFRAFLWRSGTMTDLNTIVTADSPLFLIFAISVNARGEIVGLALDKLTGDAHAFLATPNSGQSATDALGHTADAIRGADEPRVPAAIDKPAYRRWISSK